MFWTVILPCAMLVMPAPDDAEEPNRVALEYAPAPADNPLKGLVPYAGGRGTFPHSMEFDYLSFGALVKGYDEFDWGPMEELLDAIAGRGHQAIFRIYLEYPNRTGIIPEFLIADGLTVHRYVNTNTQPHPPAPIETPDYEDANLRRVLKNFIAAMGERYDGDPRIGFITAGLLGTWGEWHTYPRSDLFASPEVQAEVMDAYEAAFEVTPVLLRYPAGEGERGKAPNASRGFGYHDDSFAWATLETGRRSDSWFYMAQLRASGPEALEKWKTRPIGGEIRPEAWGRAFDEDPGDTRIQDFRRCVEETHVSWLMDSGMFRRDPPEDRMRRAEAMVRRMGYEFHVPGATIGPAEGDTLALAVEVENRGIAPFYYDWPIELGLIDEAGEVVATPIEGSLLGLPPGDGPRTWEGSIDLSGVPSGSYTVAVRAVNPLPTGKPLRFANASQDEHRDGWLSLGAISR